MARQEADCRNLCERHGWKVVDVYRDNDTSAYSGKPRPAWRRLIADIEAREIEAIAAWHIDRLTREPRELEDVIDMANRYGVDLATVTGEVDLGTPTGRMVARIIGATARQEAEHKAERQRRQRRQAAEAGKPNGGGTRPYGYDSDFVTVRRNEAEIIREAAKRVLAGESLSSVCRDFADRDVKTPKGNHWQPRTLRRLLASARISGRREHTPRSSRDNGTRPLLGEIVGKADWPAIVTPEESDRLRVLLSEPSRQRFSPASGRTYLLSGILRCGICGGGLVGRPKGKVPRYVCPNLPGGRTCGKVATVAQRTDDHVRDMVLDALDSPDFLTRVHSRADFDPALVAAIEADEAKLEELAEEWADGLLDRTQWRIARERIEPRLAANRVIVAKASDTLPLEDFIMSRDGMAERWKALDVSRRRAIVAAVLERIEVAPADRTRRWDPVRFEPIWRG